MPGGTGYPLVLIESGNKVRMMKANLARGKRYAGQIAWSGVFGLLLHFVRLLDRVYGASSIHTPIGTR